MPSNWACGNYANFNGRASRSEYWRFVAGVTLIQDYLGFWLYYVVTWAFLIMKRLSIMLL